MPSVAAESDAQWLPGNGQQDPCDDVMRGTGFNWKGVAAPAALPPVPAPLLQYAFQWWLLPRDSGGLGQGVSTEPIARATSITAALLVLLLFLMCLLAIPPIRCAAAAAPAAVLCGHGRAEEGVCGTAQAASYSCTAAGTAGAQPRPGRPPTCRAPPCCCARLLLQAPQPQPV